jgi:outer membrane protein OmpA-like peptidoglycan-associated protein
MVLCAGGTAAAQTPAPPAATASPATPTRPATTTFFGDTGIWFVPGAEVLGNGRWSVSGYRRGTNFVQGYTNVGDFAATFGVGVRDRAEIFGSFLVDTRIDRDTRPLFFNDADVGGIVERSPFAAKTWTGDHVGDLYLGAKVNLWSEYRRNPAAFAVRAIVKAPTGDKDAGVSTGKADFRVDFIGSKEEVANVDVSAFGGYEFRAKPDGIDVPTSVFNWGLGAAFPSRSPARIFGELNGGASGSAATISSASIVGADGTRPPATSNIENLTRATVGLTVQAPKGFFVGAGLSWNVPRRERVAALTDDDPFADYWDWQVRIGFHPGVNVFVPPPVPPAPAPAPAPVVQNRPPTVRARCEPCTVQVGQTSTVTADAQDPDGDTLVYRWTAPIGQFQNQADRQTAWTAPQQVGPVPVTVAVNDGRGGMASDMVVIQVVRPAPVVELMFEDVYFDFDRSTLRPEALRLLDDAVAGLMANPDKNIVIEGHTCNIGTAEYNLALGDRRATSVRNYLISRGVAASRLETRSYGEEAPKFDNAREETRRLNRRAALVVKVQ